MHNIQPANGPLKLYGHSMYYRYFGLNEAPFSIAVNPRYLFMSARHRDALAHLLYGVGEGGGFVLLTGEVGTGKTTIIRSLLEQLPENTDIAMVFNPALNAGELLGTVCDELGVPYLQDTNSLKTLTDSLHHFLLRNHARGRHTVLLIDEAQHLQFDVLEQIRLLTNLETNTRKLLQIILVGQPELRDLLNRPELRQLSQRITARYQLKPLSPEETDAYIRHRLQVAGLPANQTLFPTYVVKAVFRASRGIPRIINVLCDRMLLGAYGQGKTSVDRTLLKQAYNEVLETEEGSQLHSHRYALPIAGGIAAACLLLAIGLWWWPTPQPSPNPAVPASPPPANAETPATPTIEARPAPQPYWFDNREEALQELGRAVNLADNAPPSCDAPSTGDVRCERLQAESWQDLQSYNRPAILKLITPSRMLRYVVLIGFDSDNAFLRVNGIPVTESITELGRQWTGDAWFFWQANRHYSRPIGANDSGPAVAWLASRFASLDQQETPLSEHHFNDALQQRVILFQKAHSLKADGVAGLKTLLKLNELLESPVTLSDAPPATLSSRMGDGARGG